MKLWKLRKLTIERKIVVLKSMAISKIIHLSLFAEIPASIINLVNKILSNSYGKEKIRKLDIILYVTNTKIVD